MKPGNLTCPVCGGRMVSRLNKQKQQRFWGCMAFPKCRGTRDTDGNAPRGQHLHQDSQDDADSIAPSERQHAQDKRRWEA